MQTPDRVLERATLHHQAGRVFDAERDYLEILESEGGNADALRLLGALYVQTNRLDRAVACLEQAHFVQPENVETLNNLAVALRNCGRLEDAIRRYEQALQIDPGYRQALDNLGCAYFERGRVDDAIVLHRQALLINPDSPQTHYNLANALRARKNAAEAIAHYQHALRLNPSYVEALVNLGIALAGQGRGDEGALRFEHALHLAPQNFRALNNLGNLRRDKGDMAGAAALHRRALAVKPDYLEAYINLGTALRDMGRPGEAMLAYERALSLKPDSADALNNLGLLLHDCGRVEEAVMRYDDALHIKPDFADAKWNKALSLLALGRYREGWELYETGLAFGKRGVIPFQTRRWDGRELSGERLLIWSEQGLGDTLQFVRYAALCKQWGAQVVVQAPQPLIRLLNNCPYIDEAVIAAKEGDFDYQIPMMSLPHIFRTTPETIPAATPYFYVDEDTRRKWAPKFAGVEGLKVGLVWAGNGRARQIDAHLIDRRRSLNLSQLKPLFDLSLLKGDCSQQPSPPLEGGVRGGVLSTDTKDNACGNNQIRFYSLQAGEAASQIDQCGLRDRITDYMAEAEDFLDTAALIENLDLVITVDTSVAHLAGGLGKPVWVLSRYDACWRWLRNQEQNPWYPAARVFGQPGAGEWDAVIEKIRGALTALA